ncbi:MAG: formate dehydrogenase accessory sulfurtransferase FdhD [Ancalomicrobiaceae bacterium]|nr:formate dehydrogenase accessory sulfurtransferase FdhD [Ancalomicrobiaceae bacterium]
MSHHPAALSAGSRVFAARQFAGSDAVERDEPVAIELPVAMVFNGHSFAVMLATPMDLEDFARGFALTEGVVEDVDEIGAIELRPEERGIEVRVEIPEPRALALRARQRSLAGRSGCGICGVDRFSEALRPVAAVKSATRFAPPALRRAVADMASHQVLNADVGAVHAAAFADLEGGIRCLREDIGRHNALDKLIGALAPAGIGPNDGFLLVSSRCSYELVHKTAAAGIGLIAAISAPTSLAVELAEKVGIGLVGFAREGRFTVYASPWRISEDGAD